MISSATINAINVTLAPKSDIYILRVQVDITLKRDTFVGEIEKKLIT